MLSASDDRSVKYWDISEDKPLCDVTVHEVRGCCCWLANCLLRGARLAGLCTMQCRFSTKCSSECPCPPALACRTLSVYSFICWSGVGYRQLRPHRKNLGCAGTRRRWNGYEMAARIVVVAFANTAALQRVS